MKYLKYLVFSIVASCLSAQQLQVNQLTFSSPAPPAVNMVSTSVVGNKGTTTYYYWVIAKYPRGNAKASDSVSVTNAPNTLSGSNYVIVSWSGTSGATGYDVIRSTSPTQPTSGNIAVATNVAGTSVNDIGGALVSYTVSSIQPANETWYLDNTNCSVPMVQTPSVSGASGIVCTPPYLKAASNLSDLASASTARTNLGLTSTATTALTSLLQAGNNLSDLTNVVTARVNLGLANTATTPASTFLQVANNLSDINNATTARSNLGLGGVTIMSGTVNGFQWATQPQANGASGFYALNYGGSDNLTLGTTGNAYAGAISWLPNNASANFIYNNVTLPFRLGFGTAATAYDEFRSNGTTFSTGPVTISSAVAKTVNSVPLALTSNDAVNPIVFQIRNQGSQLWYLQPQESNVGWTQLAFNPSGGRVLVGTLTDNTTDELQVNGSQIANAYNSNSGNATFTVSTGSANYSIQSNGVNTPSTVGNNSMGYINVVVGASAATVPLYGSAGQGFWLLSTVFAKPYTTANVICTATGTQYTSGSTPIQYPLWAVATTTGFKIVLPNSAPLLAASSNLAIQYSCTGY